MAYTPTYKLAETLRKMSQSIPPSSTVKETIREVIRVERSPEITIHIARADIVPKTLSATEYRHAAFCDIVDALQYDNVFLVGPAGSGKTTLARQVADAMQVPFYFTGAINSEYKLMGFVDAQGRIVSTAFRQAWQSGGVFLFDEIDASMPGAVMPFNAALANGHCDFPDGCIEKHPNFYAIAAANTFGTGATREYVGRNQLDAATLDRFSFIELPYDEVMETAIAKEINPEHGEIFARRVQAIRKAIQTLKIRHVVSPRATYVGAARLKAGASQSAIEAQKIWKGLDQSTIERIINTL